MKSFLILFFILAVSFPLFSNQFETEINNSSISLTPNQELILHSKKVVFTKGMGFFQALNSMGISSTIALNIINGFRDEIEISKVKINDSLDCTFDGNNHIQKCVYSNSLIDFHHLQLSDDGNWVYRYEKKPTITSYRIVKGNLPQNSSLENELIKQQVSRSATNTIINILKCKINFRMTARVGDFFKILIKEEIYNGQIIDSTILFTKYEGKVAGNHESFLFQDQEKGSTYNGHYTENGEALERSSLRYPLSRIHVRSNFGNRIHPVTGEVSFHKGVDLAAKKGAPVYSVAAGKVVDSSYNPFAGKRIGIRHEDGSTSYYFHLNKKLVKKGEYVRAHQVIGEVGATGRVTGAHLHFGFKNTQGKWINPLNKRMIATNKLSGEKFNRLTQQISKFKYMIVDVEEFNCQKTCGQNYASNPSQWIESEPN